MKIKYSVLDPTGNITLLVETPAEKRDYPVIAQKLMDAEPSVQQVGFVSGNSLCMAGGEFCGNASMSAAALYCMKNSLAKGGETSVRLCVSGCEKEINVGISRNDENTFSGSVSMPKAVSVTEEAFSLGKSRFSLPVVDFGNIKHIISECTLPKAALEEAISEWCNMLSAPALGVMLTDKSTLTLTPLVYVKAANTLVWEASCASGTAAAGVYFARKNGEKTVLQFSEPGGKLKIEASPDGSARLFGNVTFVKTNIIDI